MPNTTATPTEPTYSSTIDSVWGAVGIILGVFSIFANALLVYVFIKLRRKGSVTDIIFLQLALLDCLSSFAGAFGSVFLLNGRQWFDDDSLLGDAICYPAGMLWNIASLTTPLLLSSASFGRILAVYFPFTYEKFFKFRTVLFMIIYCWSHGIVGASITFAGTNSKAKAYKMEVSWGFCDQNINTAFDNQVVRKVLYISIFTIPVIASCTTIIVCNLMVAIKILVMKLQNTKNNRRTSSAPSNVFVVAHYLQKMKRNRNDLLSRTIKQASAASNASAEGPRHQTLAPAESADKRSKKKAKRENQAILMTLLLSCNYFICYTEIIHYYVIVSMETNNFEQSYKPIFKNVTYVYLWYYFSLFAAAAINPMLHYFFNPNVKKFLGNVRSSTAASSST